MTHTQTLILNRIREAMEKLQREGVGYIDYENTGVISYKIDNSKYEIIVRQTEEQ